MEIAVGFSCVSLYILLYKDNEENYRKFTIINLEIFKSDQLRSSNRTQIY